MYDIGVCACPGIVVVDQLVVKNRCGRNSSDIAPAGTLNRWGKDDSYFIVVESVDLNRWSWNSSSHYNVVGQVALNRWGWNVGFAPSHAAFLLPSSSPQFGSVVVVVKVNEVVVPVTVVVVLVWVRVVVAVTVVGTHDPQSTGHKVCMDTPARSTLHLSADCVWHPVGSGKPLHTAVVVVVDVVVQASHKAGQLATIVGPQNRSVQSAGPKSRHPSMSKLPAQFAMVLVVVVVVLTTVVVGVEVSVVTKHRSRSPPSADSKSVFKIPAAASHPACDSKTT